jgi:pimeloyl-ACP methyl ester carboxylesterase
MTAEEEAAEARTRHLRFNIAFLSQRLSAATLWAKDEMAARNLRMGYFGSSTGAAAALVAAAELGNVVSAIVSRGGRPDLAGGSLELVSAPTLLIVGGEDTQVIPLNQEAYDRMRCEKDLRIIPGATHLFEEPGKLENVAEMASAWFVEHLHPVHKGVES